MPDHDVLYHEILESLQAGGCAICRLARRASDSYLHAVIYEGITDVKLREALREARGLCYRHAWRLGNQRGVVLGTAIVYRDVVNTLIKALETHAAAPTRFRLLRRGQSDLAQALAPTAPCPACVLEADSEQRTAKILLKHFEDTAIGDAYVAAGGLCLPHFQLALSYAGSAETKTLAERQAQAWRRLRDELDELIRKHDHRFHHEPITEAEGVSWQRSIAAAAGEGDDITLLAASAR